MSTVENNNNIFRCNICNKNYKDKSGLWYHNKKYHNDLTPPNNAKIPPNNDLTPPDNKIQCKYCNNCFTRKDSLTKHYNRCKYKKEINNIANINKDTIINNLNNKITELQEQLTNFINTSKIHPKTLHKINKQLNGDHNVINENNNINNGTVNNIQIVKFGSS